MITGRKVFFYRLKDVNQSLISVLWSKNVYLLMDFVYEYLCIYCIYTVYLHKYD